MKNKILTIFFVIVSFTLNLTVYAQDTRPTPPPGLKGTKRIDTVSTIGYNLINKRKSGGILLLLLLMLMIRITSGTC
jgi:hypothetical protein